jgi:hypothetical protein
MVESLEKKIYNDIYQTSHMWLDMKVGTDFVNSRTLTFMFNSIIAVFIFSN